MFIMGILFAEGATRNQKIGISIVICVSLLVILGIFNGTLVNNSVLKVAAIVTAFLSIVCVPLTIRPVLHMYAHEYAGRPIKRWRMYLGFTLMVLIFLYIATARGIPIILNYILSSPGEIIVTIRSKDSDYKTKHCRAGGINVVEFNLFLNSEICGFQREHWEVFKPGDQLTLLGRKSPFGFSYQRYSLDVR